MRTPGFLLASALLAAVLLQGCAPMVMVGAGAAVVAFEDRRTTGAQLEDQTIELRAGNRIDDRFGSRVHVNVTAYNRYVLLTGEVPDEAARGEIETIVRGVTNVLGVTNDLQVAGISSATSRSNDTFLTTSVKTRFLNSGKFNAIHVKVVTEASVVYLLGVVTEQEATDAVELARTTSGVRKVVKMFEYCKPTDAICVPPPPPKPAEQRPRSSP
ncbi:MAG TPA: BON domain-containing protein [Burkholderiales bacterium]|jgi:osmotically-inducible protein OsmY|nr:BON domain-containing protein [Burkholderiales bacterium]